MAARPVLRRALIASRQFSAKTAIPFDDIKVTSDKSGVVVATQNTKLPLATVGIVVGAGPRHETAAVSGASTYLNATAFQSSQDYTAFATTREAEILGAQFSVQSGRDFTLYRVTVPVSNVDKASHILASAATKQLFHPWEVREQDERVEQAHVSSQQQLVDAAFQLAFRKNLGRSAIIAHHKIGHVSSDALTAFYNDRFVASNIGVIGVGVEHAHFEGLFASLLAHLSTKPVVNEAAKFYGGAVESRTTTGSGSSSSVIAFAAGAQDQISANILARLLATPASVKWGNSGSRTGLALGKAGLSGSVGSFSKSFSDATLFGVSVSSDSASAHKVVTTAAAEIKAALNGAVSEAEFNRAKNLFAADILESDRTAWFAHQVARTRGAVTPETVAASANALSFAAFKDFVAKVGASKPVYTSSGSLDNTPYYDELGF